MKRVALPGVLLVLIGLTWCASACAAAPRDWKAFPAIAVAEQADIVYGVGDVHGDYDKLVELLLGAKIIKTAPQKPEDVQWDAGKAVLVCTGDMIDKGPKAVEVLRFMRALQRSAQNSGGEVIVTLGNHEARFLAGSASEKKTDFYEELKSLQIDPDALAGGTDAEGLGQWLRTRPIAAKVGDWFFSHAGNSGGSTLKKLEADIEMGVDKDGFGAFVLAQPNSILEAKTAPVPWWIAGGSTTKASDNGEAGAARLLEYAHALGCAHLVMGHQPGNVRFGDGVERKKSEPFAYKGVLFLMDVGMSRGVDDAKGVVLKIETQGKAKVSAIYSSGAAVELWKGE